MSYQLKGKKKDLTVAGFIDYCEKKNIKNIIVITAGFKEVGEEGIEMEKLLMDIVWKESIIL